MHAPTVRHQLLKTVKIALNFLKKYCFTTYANHETFVYVQPFAEYQAHYCIRREQKWVKIHQEDKIGQKRA